MLSGNKDINKAAADYFIDRCRRRKQKEKIVGLKREIGLRCLLI